jgi:hypothetical protein
VYKECAEDGMCVLSQEMVGGRLAEDFNFRVLGVAEIWYFKKMGTGATSCLVLISTMGR